MKSKFNIGDKVVLKDYEILRKNRHVSEDNEVFKRHYDYVKSKEPLTVAWIYEPGDLSYSIEDCDNVELRGTQVKQYIYNIQTPRSKLYLYEECELDVYVEPESEAE